MMANRKKIVAISICIGAGLAAVLVAILLWREVHSFRQTRRDLEESEARLERLYRMTPFPSSENVDRERENLEMLSEWFETLLQELRKGRIEPATVTAPRFSHMYFEKRERLRSLADEAGVQLAGREAFAFGFDRYADGVVPEAEHVPRLLRQLLIVEKIAELLVQEKVESIETLARPQFEVADAPRRARGSRPRGAEPQPVEMPTREEGRLYETTRITLSFTATEPALIRFLNRIKEHETFMAVANLELESVGEDVSRPDVPGPTTLEERRKIPLQNHPVRTDRRVTGRPHENFINVQMELDVYRFEGDSQG